MEARTSALGVVCSLFSLVLRVNFFAGTSSRHGGAKLDSAIATRTVKEAGERKSRLPQVAKKPKIENSGFLFKRNIQGKSGEIDCSGHSRLAVGVWQPVTGNMQGGQKSS